MLDLTIAALAKGILQCHPNALVSGKKKKKAFCEWFTCSANRPLGAGSSAGSARGGNRFLLFRLLWKWNAQVADWRLNAALKRLHLVQRRLWHSQMHIKRFESVCLSHLRVTTFELRKAGALLHNPTLRSNTVSGRFDYTSSKHLVRFSFEARKLNRSIFSDCNMTDAASAEWLHLIRSACRRSRCRLLSDC